MATSRRVLGRELLRKKLAALPKAVKVNLQASLSKDAEELATLMRSRVNDRTGALSSSIVAEPFNRGGIGAIIRAGGKATTKPVRQGQSATYDYAMAIELGTQDALARPFFYPSFRLKRTTIKRRASKAVRAAVAQV